MNLSSLRKRVGAEPVQEPPRKSRRTKLFQGALVLLVMFVGLRWLLSRNANPE